MISLINAGLTIPGASEPFFLMFGLCSLETLPLLNISLLSCSLLFEVDFVCIKALLNNDLKTHKNA